MILGAFCALACALAPWHAAVQPDGTVTMNGAKVGVYVDNETPNQQAVVAADVRAGEAVIAGVPPCCPNERFPGAIAAVEWYPFFNGAAMWPVSPPPAQAYIVQGHFRWPGDPHGASPVEQHQLWLDATANDPVLVLTY